MSVNTKNKIKYDYDLLIIGGGPAGLTAAIYAQRANLKTVIIEKYLPGGKMTKTAEIENYPGIGYTTGPELSEKMQQQVEKLNVNFIYDEVINISDNEMHTAKTVSLADGKAIIVKAIIIATGCIERRLNVIGEREYENRGVSYCAVCDGFLYKDKVVTVVGGGYAACEEALFLTRITNKVNLIHRRDQFRADEIAVKRVKENSSITMYLNYVVDEIIGNNEKEQVAAIKITNTKTNKTKILETAAVFPYIGSDPITDFVRDLGICDKNGYILVDDTCQTKIPGLFAAGDVIAKKLRQIVTATSDGAIAAQYVINFIDIIG